MDMEHFTQEQGSAHEIFFPLEQRHEEKIQNRDAELQCGSSLQHGGKLSVIHLDGSSFPNSQCIHGYQVKKNEIRSFVTETIEPVCEIGPNIENKCRDDQPHSPEHCH